MTFPDSRQTRPAQLSVSVLTFNIHHGVGTDGVLDLERIAGVLRASGAHVIALQEVDRHFGGRSDWQDQAARLADLLGFELAYGTNVDREPPVLRRRRRQYGTAVLSRYSIVGWQNTHLVCSAGEEQRGLLHVEIDLAGVPLHVYNTHLEASSQAARVRQAKQVADLIGDNSTAVLLGDLNASPDSPEIRALGAGFTDVWTIVDDGGVMTYPSAAPQARIDHIFAGRRLEPVSADVVTVDAPASDHLPVRCGLTVRP